MPEILMFPDFGYPYLDPHRMYWCKLITAIEQNRGTCIKALCVLEDYDEQKGVVLVLKTFVSYYKKGLG